MLIKWVITVRHKSVSYLNTQWCMVSSDIRLTSLMGYYLLIHKVAVIQHNGYDTSSNVQYLCKILKLTFLFSLHSPTEPHLTQLSDFALNCGAAFFFMRINNVILQQAADANMPNLQDMVICMAKLAPSQFTPQLICYILELLGKRTKSWNMGDVGHQQQRQYKEQISERKREKMPMVIGDLINSYEIKVVYEFQQYVNLVKCKWSFSIQLLQCKQLNKRKYLDFFSLIMTTLKFPVFLVKLLFILINSRGCLIIYFTLN